MTAPHLRALRDTDRTDRAGVGDLIRAAFADEGDAVATLWADVVARGHVRAELVAEAPGSGALVGHVGLSHAWLDARRELVDILVLSPLSVAPDWQRQGVGAALLTAAVAAAEEAGAPYVVLEGDPGFYGRRGWEPASVYGLEAPSHRVPEPAFQVVPLAARESWMTGRVIYREVWWDHDATGLRDPLLASLEMELG